jgi:hypothetical protein
MDALLTSRSDRSKIKMIVGLIEDGKGLLQLTCIRVKPRSTEDDSSLKNSLIIQAKQEVVDNILK